MERLLYLRGKKMGSIYRNHLTCLIALRRHDLRFLLHSLSSAYPDATEELEAEFLHLEEDRHLTCKMFSTGDAKIVLPFNPQRLIWNAQKIFHVETRKATSLSPLHVIVVIRYISLHVIVEVRKLSKKLIIISGEDKISKQGQCNATLLMNAFIRYTLCSKKMALTHMAFDWLTGEIETRLQQAIAQPGEMVGALAVQCVGEPATQITFKTFYCACLSAKNLTLSVPCLKKINVSKPLKTPSLTVFLQSAAARDAGEPKDVLCKLTDKKMSMEHFADKIRQGSGDDLNDQPSAKNAEEKQMDNMEDNVVSRCTESIILSDLTLQVVGSISKVYMHKPTTDEKKRVVDTPEVRFESISEWLPETDGTALLKWSFTMFSISTSVSSKVFNTGCITFRYFVISAVQSNISRIHSKHTSVLSHFASVHSLRKSDVISAGSVPWLPELGTTTLLSFQYLPSSHSDFSSVQFSFAQLHSSSQCSPNYDPQEFPDSSVCYIIS